MLSRSLLSRGVPSAATLTAARSALQAAFPRAPPSHAASRGLPCIAQGSTVRASPLGVMRAPTGSGLGWAGMAGEGVRCFISTGPLRFDVTSSRLLPARADQAAKADEEGKTPLHFAAEAGRAALVAQLLKAGEDMEAKEDQDGWTPLHYGAREGHAAVVKKLLAAGADKEAKDAGGWTPLHLAASSGGGASCTKEAPATKALLAAKADVNAKNNGGRTPLHHAAYWGHKAAIEALLAAKADVHAQSDCGETPLHWAARMGQEAAIKALLAAKADVHAQNEGGRTPLHRAAYSGLEIKTFQAAKADGSAENHDDLGQEAAIRALLAAKADLNAKDIDGNTPLLLAVAYRQTSAAQVLREAGATA